MLGSLISPKFSVAYLTSCTRSAETKCGSSQR